MRGLFPRIFLSFWLAMTLIGAGFALIYATAGPGKFGTRRVKVFTELLEAHVELVQERLTHGDPEGAARAVRRLAERTGVRAVVVVDGGPPIGDARLAREQAALAAEARRGGAVVRRELAGRELYAVPSADAVIVGEFPQPSWWERFIGPSPLSLRLFLVFVVAGLVSLLLARVLTSPLSHLRRATQALAGGDLSVRVSPQLGGASAEIAGLGRDFDRMAERIAGLLEAQQRLLRDVSHELRSPLARLRVALELARQRAGEGATAPLDRIEREAERLGELIGHILTVSRLDGLDTLQKDELDLSALVAEVVRDADYEGKGLGRSVQLVAAPECRLSGNGEVLRWAVDNVLRNALRFTPEGTAVEVRLSHEARDGQPVVAVEVRDHGPGVPEEELTSIFEPFYRISASRDRKTGGAGVGLAITDRGVRLHGGTVRAANAAGGGLVVTMELPVAA